MGNHSCGTDSLELPTTRSIISSDAADAYERREELDAFEGLTVAHRGLVAESQDAERALIASSQHLQGLRGELTASAKRHHRQLASNRILRDDVQRAAKRATALREGNEVLRSRLQAANERISTVAKTGRGAQADTRRLTEEREKLALERERLRAGIKALRSPGELASSGKEARVWHHLTDCLQVARLLPPGRAETAKEVSQSRSYIEAMASAAQHYRKSAQEAKLQYNAILMEAQRLQQLILEAHRSQDELRHRAWDLRRTYGREG